MHVQLDKDNAEKMLKASGKLGKSVNEIVNALIRSLDVVDITEEIRLEFKPKCETLRVKKKNSHRSSNWINNF